MTTTITLYRIEARDITLHDGFALRRPDYDETKAGIEKQRYVLPTGYTVGEIADGSMAIFDAANRYCHIEMHASGRPQLVSAASKMPVMAEA